MVVRRSGYGGNDAFAYEKYDRATQEGVRIAGEREYNKSVEQSRAFPPESEIEQYYYFPRVRYR